MQKLTRQVKTDQNKKTKTTRSVPRQVLHYANQEHTKTDLPNTNSELSEGNSLRLNWDVIGLSTTAITIGGAAIFFVSGWFYEARWYSFFGINIHQLSLSPIDFMVQGIPGILFFSISFVLCWLFIKLSKGLFQTFWTRQPKNDSLESAFVNILLRSELIWAGILSFFLLSILAMVGELVFSIMFSRTYEPSFIGLMGGAASITTLFFVLYFYASLRREAAVFKEIIVFFAPFFRRRSSIIQSTMNGAISIITMGIIALTFMTSISISGVLGQFDAIQHKRGMSGWFLPRTIVISYRPIPILSEYPLPPDNADFYSYGPFALVASDDEKYYFVKYIEGRYLENPMVYTVNRQNVELAFVVTGATYLIGMEDIKSYFPTKTPTPMPSHTPTSIPSVQTTPTP